MTEKSLLCDTEHVVAIGQDFGGEHLVITFNAMGFARNGLQFWGDTFLAKNRISAIGIMTARPNWYPSQAMNVVCDALDEAIRGRHVVTYGHSQGGYGALKYGARLGAKVALAFSPQWSINPGEVATFDNRFCSYFDESLENGLPVEAGDIGDRAFIFFDRKDVRDAAHAEKLAKLARVEKINCPFSLHDTVRLVTESRTAVPLLQLCMQPTLPATHQLRSVIRSSRRASTTYSKTRRQQLLIRLERSKAWSMQFLRSALTDAGPEGLFYEAAISHLAGEKDGRARAMQQLASTELAGDQLLFYWSLCNRAGFLDGELLVSESILRQGQDNTWACLHAVNTYIRCGRLAGAEAELRRLRQNKDCLNYMGTFAEFSIKLQMYDLLEEVLSQPIPLAAKLPALFGVTDTYSRIGERSRAFKILMQLATLCKESATDMQRVAKALLRIGESRYALELLEQLNRRRALDLPERLDVAEAWTALDRDKGRQQLGSLAVDPRLTPEQVERTASLLERVGLVKGALECVDRARSRSHANIALMHRRAQLLWQLKRKFRARRQLRALRSEKITDTGRLRQLADLAFKFGDRRLAVRFAEQQFECDPKNPECIIFLARNLILIDRVERAGQLLEALYNRETQCPFLSGEQWLRLANGLYEAKQLKLAHAAAAESARQLPHNAEAKKLTTTVALLIRIQEGPGVATALA